MGTLYVVLIKSVPVIVYCGVREWSLHGLLHKFSSGLGVPGNDSLINEISPILENKSV